MDPKRKTLLVILGPTCVGKSTTAIKVAKLFNGEIINCDSMQVYRGFDIGTDKMPQDRRENIPHHLLDIISPSVRFSAADFVQFALEIIDKIHDKNRLPIVTGGTGLYLKALLNGLFSEGKSDPVIRKRLESEAEEKGLASLSKKLRTVDPQYAKIIGNNDKYRIIRALEVFEATNKPLSEHFASTRSFVEDLNVLKIGLKIDRQTLYKNIEKRVDEMFAKGLVEEVKLLLESGVDAESPPFRALGYKHVFKHLKKDLTLEEAISLTKRDTRHYAKRQMTWFRKMEGIHWFNPENFDSLKGQIKEFLDS
ncbi:tRNA (adenosine(37)-N6)-dimethylallyltransferase MiaA [Acidobacteriota bacterium]